MIVAFLYCSCLLFVLLLHFVVMFGVCFIVAFCCYCYGLVLVLLCGQHCCWLLFLVFVFVLLYVCGMFCVLSAASIVGIVCSRCKAGVDATP